MNDDLTPHDPFAERLAAHLHEAAAPIDGAGVTRASVDARLGGHHRSSRSKVALGAVAATIALVAGIAVAVAGGGGGGSEEVTAAGDPGAGGAAPPRCLTIADLRHEVEAGRLSVEEIVDTAILNDGKTRGWLLFQLNRSEGDVDAVFTEEQVRAIIEYERTLGERVDELGDEGVPAVEEGSTEDEAAIEDWIVSLRNADLGLTEEQIDLFIEFLQSYDPTLDRTALLVEWVAFIEDLRNGEVPRADFMPPDLKLTDEQIDDLLEHLWSLDLDPVDQDGLAEEQGLATTTTTAPLDDESTPSFAVDDGDIVIVVDDDVPLICFEDRSEVASTVPADALQTTTTTAPVTTTEPDPSIDSTTPDPIDLPLSFCDPVDRPRPDLSTVDALTVYLEPGASDAQVAEIGRVLEADGAVNTITYMDEAATYADFQALFAGRDTMLDNIEPADLPTSFRARTVVSDDAMPELVERYRALPGVFEVRTGPQCQEPVEATPATTTTTAPVTTTEAPPD